LLISRGKARGKETGRFGLQTEKLWSISGRKLGERNGSGQQEKRGKEGGVVPLYVKKNNHGVTKEYRAREPKMQPGLSG